MAFAEGTGADCPGEGIICRPGGCAAWLLLSFHNFGYKIIQLKEVTENKAMQGRVWGWGGVQCMTGGRGFTTLQPSPVQWFLLKAGDSSPASLSSSAWSCQSWSPLRYRACHSLLQLVEVWSDE